MTAEKRPSWPLLVLAGLSLIPFLGFFIAAVAITWALVTSRPRAKTAIILASVGALLTVAESVLLMVVMKDRVNMSDVWAAGARQDMERIAVELERYRGANGRYPDDLGAIQGGRNLLLNISDQTSGFMSQKSYQYRPTDVGTYDLFGVGADKLPDTKDDVRVLNDTLQATTGYRPGGQTTSP